MSAIGPDCVGTMPRRIHAALLMATSLLVLAVTVLHAVPARAAFGDGFGIAPAAGAAFPGSSSLWAGTCDLSHPQAAVGSAPSAPRDCIDFGTPNGALFPVTTTNPWTTPPSWRLQPVAQAGSHPDATTTFTLNRDPQEVGLFNGLHSDGDLRDLSVDLPPGLVGNVTAVTPCAAEQAREVFLQCPPSSQVGVITNFIYALANVQTDVRPVYLVEARRGKAAELIIEPLGTTNIPQVASLRSDGDFGLRLDVRNIPLAYGLLSTQVTLWGVPWASSHDLWRNPQGRFCTFDGCTNGTPPSGLPSNQQVHYDPSWGPIKPFLTLPTSCSDAIPITRVALDSYSHPGRHLADGAPDTSDASWKTYDAPADAVVDGCGKNSFAPELAAQPTTPAPDSASGLTVDVTVPQNNDPPPDLATSANDDTGAPAYWRTDAGVASAHLHKALVRLPEGVSVNPSAASGLEGCSDAQIGYDANTELFTKDEPSCPDGSRIGTVDVTSPLISEHLSGEVILGSPKSTDPQSGQMFRLFIVARNLDRGLLVKIYGSAVADPNTGRLTATFDNNPQLPFDHLHLDLKGGQRGLLGMPQSCGPKSTSATFTPWTADNGAGGAAKEVGDSFTVGGDCSFGFAPSLSAGMSTGQAGASGNFSFTFSRPDGQQWFSGLTATLPTGLLANTRGVPLCSSADAAAGTCPEGSRIGTVDAGAGSGTPFFLEKKGIAYLTEGYKGCPYGLSVVVPVEAGPFSGQYGLGNIVVRQAVCVDPVDAHVTVTSDPFPTIWHGIPLRIRQVTVSVDRAGFMVNPTSCAAKQITGSFRSASGATAIAGTPFSATGCAALPYKPKLAMQLLDKKQTHDGGHPGIEAVLTQQPGEANVKSAKVTLPLSLALDPDNAEGLCEYATGQAVQGGAVACPASSIVGRATAVSPLLNRPLTGNVYFVKNVRFNSKGQAIRTLPTLLIPLRGEIAIDLRATSDVDSKGRLVNTFSTVPDAPIKAFHLTINGGKHGIIVVTHNRDVCRGGQVAFADTDAQNGKRHDFDVALQRPCPKTTRPKVGKVSVKGHTVRVAVTVPTGGIVTAKGANAHLGTVKRTLKRRATAHLTLRLSRAGLTSLRRHSKLTVKVALSFVPKGAKKAQAASVSATLRNSSAGGARRKHGSR